MLAFPRARRCGLNLAIAIAALSTLKAQEIPAIRAATVAFDPLLTSSTGSAVEPSESFAAAQPYQYHFRSSVPNPFTDEALSRYRTGNALAMASGNELNTSSFKATSDLLAGGDCLSSPCATPAVTDSASTAPASRPPLPADAQPGSTQGRQVSWKLIVPNFLSDQERIWLFPVDLAEGKHWVPTIPIVATTGALIASDPFTAPYFRNTNKFHGFNHVFKDPTTEWVFLGLPVLWYFGGLVGHSKYAQETGFLAAETLVDVDFLAGVMRSVDGRLHPRDIPLPQNGGDYTHTWFKAKGTYVNRGSFPSGHTAGAFAAATVFSRRYGRRHRWVPWVSYSLAAVTGFSRISWSAHFPSDVFLGATLAYVIGRYVVLRNAEEPLGDDRRGTSF